MVAAAVFTFAVGVLVTAGVTVFVDSRTVTVAFDPISYSKQTITTPVIRNGEAVAMTGSRCSDAETPVKVQGRTTWVLYTPSGQRFAGPIGGALREPGCVQLSATISMPVEVIAINRTLFEQGLSQAQWRLEGSAVPLEDDGTPGTPAFWKSTVFSVIP